MSEEDKAIDELESIRKEVKSAVSKTWSQIASDWMEGHEGELNASHIAEAVFDADRITFDNPNLSFEALRYIGRLEWPDDMIELCKDI
jgi:hypothetical protein